MSVDWPETIARTLSEAAAECPDRTFLHYEGRKVSYAELFDRVTAAAAGLVALGVQPGARVAVWAANTLGAATALLALPAAGAQIVPLNTRYQIREAEQIVTNAGCGVVIAPEEFLGRQLAREAQGIAGVTCVVSLGEGASGDVAQANPGAGVLAWDALLAGADDEARTELARRIASQTGRDVSLIQFTSGTTGCPKGAMLRQGPMLATALTWTREVGLAAGEIFPIGYPLAHIGGFKTGLLTTLVSRASAVLFPVVDTPSLIAAMTSFRPAVISAPPPVLHTILNALRDGALPTSTTVRTVVTGSAIVPAALVHDLRQHLHVTDVINAYGLTEATGVCTMTRRGDPVDLVCETIGRPIDGVEVRLAGRSDNEDEQALGEIEVRGPNLMTGYLGDPVATAETMHDGWLRTGDLGRIGADGYVRIVGRLKDIVVVGGFNVYPAEVEHVLAAHPAVAEAAAVGVPDERLGEVVVAFVVPSDEIDGPLPDGRELTAWCRENLANFKVPRRLWWTPELPRVSSAKVAKGELRRRAMTALIQESG